MMSLTKVSLTEVVKKQYSYKLKAYGQVFMTLIVLQLLAILFSYNGVGTMGSSSDSLEINVHYYSANIVVGFTMLWGFISAILITTKAYRNDDFTFVTNRLSSNLSNMLYLLTASLIGGITAMLSTPLMKVIMYSFGGQPYGTSANVWAAPVELLVGILATSLYVFLCCALGCIFGTLVQIHKVFVILLPGLYIGVLSLAATNGTSNIVETGFEFIFAEPSILLFIGKIITISGLLFTCSFILSNRMEVKQ
jgi:hypothetical protein